MASPQKVHETIKFRKTPWRFINFFSSCHPDELVVRRWMGFDQFGLWTAIIGCYVPGLRLALWCFPEVNWLYSCTVIFTGVSGMILLRVQIWTLINVALKTNRKTVSERNHIFEPSNSFWHQHRVVIVIWNISWLFYWLQPVLFQLFTGLLGVVLTATKFNYFYHLS